MRPAPDAALATTTSAHGAKPAESGYTVEEDAAIQQRLADLGYL